MLKWIEIAKRNQKERYEVLSELANQQGVKNQVEFVEVTDEDWKDKAKEVMSRADAIRVGPGLSEIILSLFHYSELEVRHLGVSDTLMFEADKWWPRSAGYQGLVRALTEIGHQFQLGTEVLIVGTGGLAKLASAALFKEGYTQFTLVGDDIARGEKVVADLRKSYLGAKFDFVQREGLILLPANYGVCASTIPATENNIYLKDLSYFNFLLPEGYLIDFTMEDGVSPLVDEAHHIGAKALPGPRLFAHIDVRWFEMVSGVEISVDKLCEAYINKFQPKV